MALSADVRNYLARKWYMDELGRPPSGKEQTDRARIIELYGVDAAFAGVYDSAEAQKYRRDTGRKV